MGTSITAASPKDAETRLYSPDKPDYGHFPSTSGPAVPRLHACHVPMVVGVFVRWAPLLRKADGAGMINNKL